MRVSFHSGTLQLEGVLTHPAAATDRAAVICHPHPQYGGDMENGVVRTVASVFENCGWATLRFNFRGVGASEGSFDHGIGEIDDARAAVHAVCERSGASRVTLAGYSFGAMVALRAGATLPEVERLIAVAPPLAFFDLGMLATCEKAKLFVIGDNDQFCSQNALAQQLERIADPKSHSVVKGADHFFAGREAALAAALRCFDD